MYQLFVQGGVLSILMQFNLSCMYRTLQLTYAPKTIVSYIA